MPHFLKSEKELETRFDKWLYVLKKLPYLQDRPAQLQERVFQRLFDAAEIAKFTKTDYEQYETSLKIYRDLKNVTDTAREDGVQEGILSVAQNMLTAGESVEKVSQYTGLSIEQVRSIDTRKS